MQVLRLTISSLNNITRIRLLHRVLQDRARYPRFGDANLIDVERGLTQIAFIEICQWANLTYSLRYRSKPPGGDTVLPILS